MSGIFAYIGSQPCKSILTNGISQLQKRGCDTNGILLKNKDDFTSTKVKGGIDQLSQSLQSLKNDSTIGLAQCDKAIRCKPSDLTAKPVCNNLFGVVMDGYIENFSELKRWSTNPFPIHTDEDLLLALLCVINKKDKLEAVKALDTMIVGDLSYAFIPVDENAIYCKSNGKPIVIGISDKGFYISSELKAIINSAEKYIILDDDDCAKISVDKLLIYDNKYKKIKKSPIQMPEQSYFENDYSIKDEIFYCPLAVKEACKQFIKKSKLDLDYLKMTRHSADKISRIIITGSSTSYNTAKLCEYNFSMLCDIPTTAYTSQELRYSGCIIDKNTLLIAISHTGEGEETIACAKRFKANGAKVFAVTGNRLSYLAHISDEVIDTGCDFESREVSLRCFISTYLAVTFLSLYIGYKNSVVTELYLNVAIKMAEMLSGKVSSAIKPSPSLEMLASSLTNSENVFISGLGADYPLSLEGADKLRLIAKINATAYPLGELISKCSSLLDNSLVVAPITNKELMQKSLYTLRRAKSMGANVIIITTQSIEEEITDFDKVISFNDSIPIFNILPCTATMYKVAITAEEIKSTPDINIAG